MNLGNLATIARRTGYPVKEISGWERRMREPQSSVEGIVCHHTAGPVGNGDYPSLAVVRDGRTGLPGPLSHYGLGRSGTIYVIAAGRCNHNAPSTSPFHTNSRSIGIEAENNGRQPWPAAQLDSYKKLCAELCKAFDLPASRVKGHKEVNTSKPDPHTISMNAFRDDIEEIIEGNDLTPEDVRKAVWEMDKCPAPYDPEGNVNWTYENVLRTGALAYKRQEVLEKKMDEILLLLRELSTE